MQLPIDQVTLFLLTHIKRSLNGKGLTESSTRLWTLRLWVAATSCRLLSTYRKRVWIKAVLWLIILHKRFQWWPRLKRIGGNRHHQES